MKGYDRYLIQYSTGKDSLSCLLHLLEIGVPPQKIELWHQLVDGREGSALMTWPYEVDYARATARHFGLPLLFQWRAGGFERELLKSNDRIAPAHFELPDGRIGQAGGTTGAIATRRRFPQQGANQATRWCSSALKIEVAAAAIRNDERLRHSRTLVITGERAEESPARAKYKEFEPHRADARAGKLQRHVDHWRPIHRWTERQVWQTIERWGIHPAPAYYLGFSRHSCAGCIFNTPRTWATLAAVNPAQFQRIAALEKEFGVTIRRDRRYITELLLDYQPYPTDPAMVAKAMSETWVGPVTMDPWVLPQGAYAKENCGPT